MRNVKRKIYTSKQLRKRYNFVNNVAALLAKKVKVITLENEYPSPCEGHSGCWFYTDEYSCEECQLANYIYELTRRRRKNMKQNVDETERALIEKIVDRAEELKVLRMDREVAIAFMELAAKHYNLSLLRMLEGSDFDFMHDFVYMPQHFHKETGTFDNHFLPRFSKQSLGEV